MIYADNYDTGQNILLCITQKRHRHKTVKQQSKQDDEVSNRPVSTT